jgi:hypothetical protein
MNKIKYKITMQSVTGCDEKNALYMMSQMVSAAALKVALSN